ncbi:MAG: hypothetical protein COB30_000605 [Ectothiorhodospiraceae bacterium]|nr:hypothetical protein [Ectothiorhodospiraceae bacterium]
MNIFKMAMNTSALVLSTSVYATLIERLGSTNYDEDAIEPTLDNVGSTIDHRYNVENDNF